MILHIHFILPQSPLTARYTFVKLEFEKALGQTVLHNQTICVHSSGVIRRLKVTSSFIRSLWTLHWKEQNRTRERTPLRRHICSNQYTQCHSCVGTLHIYMKRSNNTTESRTSLASCPLLSTPYRHSTLQQALRICITNSNFPGRPWMALRCCFRGADIVRITTKGEQPR